MQLWRSNVLHYQILSVQQVPISQPVITAAPPSQTATRLSVAGFPRIRAFPDLLFCLRGSSKATVTKIKF